MDNWLSQMRTGTKHLTERYAEYPAAAHDQQLYYGYESSSPSHGHVVSSKNHYGGGGHKGGPKSGAAMSALTLLAFLFFLHILQQCLKEHMTAMTTPQVMVVSAGRDGDQVITRVSNKGKLDKAGIVNEVSPAAGVRPGAQLKNKKDHEYNAPTSSSDSARTSLMRVATAEHTPRGSHADTSRHTIYNYSKVRSASDGFVSAMDENT